MVYQYLRHDGFYFRRPRRPPEEWNNEDGMEIWNGLRWMTPRTVDDAMMPSHYGMEVPEEVALRQVEIDQARNRITEQSE